MKTLHLFIAFLLVCTTASCAHGIAKGKLNDGETEDSVDTVLIDTVYADSVAEVNYVYYDPEAKISYYYDEILYFRIPSGYRCIRRDDDVVFLVNENNEYNYMAFDYYDARPNENAESAVKELAVEILQTHPNSVLEHSSDMPVLSKKSDIRSQYLAVINVEDEQNPATIAIFGVLLKNSHLYLFTMQTTDDHNRSMFMAVLKTVIMK